MSHHEHVARRRKANAMVAVLLRAGATSAAELRRLPAAQWQDVAALAGFDHASEKTIAVVIADFERAEAPEPISETRRIG